MAKVLNLTNHTIRHYDLIIPRGEWRVQGGRVFVYEGTVQFPLESGDIAMEVSAIRYRPLVVANGKEQRPLTPEAIKDINGGELPRIIIVPLYVLEAMTSRAEEWEEAGVVFLAPQSVEKYGFRRWWVRQFVRWP